MSKVSKYYYAEIAEAEFHLVQSVQICWEQEKVLIKSLCFLVCLQKPNCPRGSNENSGGILFFSFEWKEWEK